MQHAHAFQAVPSFETSADRGEILQWAEPIIADRLRDVYFDAVDSSHAYQLMAHHRQLWRSVLLETHAIEPAARQLLRTLGRNAGLRTGFIEAVDQAILEELLEIVLLRSNGSRSRTKEYSLMLIAVATGLGASRAAA